jgi:hypothetical protein
VRLGRPVVNGLPQSKPQPPFKHYHQPLHADDVSRLKVEGRGVSVQRANREEEEIETLLQYVYISSNLWSHMHPEGGSKKGWGQSRLAVVCAPGGYDEELEREDGHSRSTWGTLKQPLSPVRR